MSQRPLRVLVDARMLIGRFAGVSRVVTRLIETLAGIDRFRVVALCGDALHAPWLDRRDIEQLTTTFTRADRTPFRRLRWEARHLARFIRAARADVYHATWNSGVPAFCPAPALLTIHDLIPWNQSRPWFEPWCYRRSVRASALRAARITAVSDYSRGEILRTLGVDSRRVVTVPNGVDGASDSAPAKFHSTRPYVLFVGGHEPRKNVAGMLRAMRAYWSVFGFETELRLTGTLDRLNRDAAMTLNELPAEAPVVFLGDPRDDELGLQYRGAAALLMLSRAEGFGLPALEAMAHGCPVIAARLASLPEVIGDAGVLVDPDNPQLVADELHRIIVDRSARSDLIRRGRQRASQFAWRPIVDRYAHLYLALHAESIAAGRQVESNRAAPDAAIQSAVS